MSINNLDPLGIDYAITEDDFDGAPVVPGFASDGDFWACAALAAAESGVVSSSSPTNVRKTNGVRRATA